MRGEMGRGATPNAFSVDVEVPTIDVSADESWPP